MGKLALALLYHHHQPYYPDDVSRDSPMPWVRLHGVKDYAGMALHLFDHPQMRCTFNITPCLITQLQGYVEKRLTDRFAQMTLAEADQLSEDDACFLLDNFFLAKPETMIQPFPRYWELMKRRSWNTVPAQKVVKQFSSNELRDLQMWHNLAWIHPLLGDRDDEIRAWITKGRDFTEADKQRVLAKQSEILANVLPMYKQLAERGQIEISTTPFYHPILPLLLDKNSALQAMPDATLPKFTGGYPDDAAYHLDQAVSLHKEVFGSAPSGMWPSEGSVSPSIIPYLQKRGIRWIATDEEILFHSLGKSRSEKDEILYHPYLVEHEGSQLQIIFRDQLLSNMMGFGYTRWPERDAADDFVNRLHAIRRHVPENETALVSVVLDGENCWEDYPEGGVTFLPSLYKRLATDDGIETVTVNNHLLEHPATEKMPGLFAGSWIRHNFAIWIGHEEDNKAWDAIHRTREFLLKTEKEGKASGEALRKAWEEIYIAEGSDWFWWFGDDHRSAQDHVFDGLFRTHLQNVYRLLGKTPPAELEQPIKRFQ